MLRAKALLAAQCPATCKCPDPQHEHSCLSSFPNPHGVTVFHGTVTEGDVMMPCHCNRVFLALVPKPSVKGQEIMGGVSPKEKLQLTADWLLFAQHRIIFTQAGSTFHCCPCTFWVQQFTEPLRKIISFNENTGVSQ